MTTVSNGDVRLVRIQLAARDALWMVAVLCRLREGEALSHELADAAGASSRGTFKSVRDRMRDAGMIVATGQRIGRNGCIQFIWSLPEQLRRAA